MMESDAELEQALYAAFAREAPPATLMAGVEGRLAENSGTLQLAPADAGGRMFIPTFAGLEITTQSRWTSILSVGTHLLLCSLILLFALDQWHTRQVQKKLMATDVIPFIPAANLKDTMGGGGGGGNHELLEASKGKLPKFAKQQIAPPQILRLDNPKLAVEPTVVMPPIKLPDASMPDLGVPQSPQVAFASQGSGSGSGFGTGSGGGIGSGRGNGVGPGEGGGYGEGSTTSAAGFRTPSLYMLPIRSSLTRRGAPSTRASAWWGWWWMGRAIRSACTSCGRWGWGSTKRRWKRCGRTNSSQQFSRAGMFRWKWISR